MMMCIKAFSLLCIILLHCGGGQAVRIPAVSDSAPLEWWKEAIIYQVYPRSHQDSDGDGTGDLKGIQDRLDHFKDLGIGAVWISPIYKSPMIDFGYDISDFTDIDPTFGNMTDFDNLQKAMKDMGIKLIMDFVPNHSSDQHEWFQKSVKKEGKYTDYYVWRDANGKNASGHPQPPNNWNSVFGGSAWEWSTERQQYYLHQFTKEQPDVNFENRAVIDEFVDIVKFWLEKGVDGFRMDAVPHMFEDQAFLDEPLNPDAAPGTLPTDHAYLSHIYTYSLPGVFEVLAELRKVIDDYSAVDGIQRVMMVEATNPTLDEVFMYYGTPEKPIANFPFNFEFINRIKPGFGGNDVASLVDEWFCKMPEGNVIPNWLMGNHDNGRVASRFAPWVVDPFNMLLLLLPGSAVTYYGEEIGMTNADISWEDTVDPPGCAAGKDRYKQFSRDPERTPMQWNGQDANAGFSTAAKTWLPMHPDWKTVNVNSSKSAPGLTHMKVYQEVTKLRDDDIWRYGSLETKALRSGTMFGFARIYKGSGFIYLANFGDTERFVNIPMEFEGIPSTATVAVTSVGYLPATIKMGDSVKTTDLKVGAKHAIIVKFTATP